jgi:hypothetical protein
MTQCIKNVVLVHGAFADGSGREAVAKVLKNGGLHGVDGAECGGIDMALLGQNRLKRAPACPSPTTPSRSHNVRRLEGCADVLCKDWGKSQPITGGAVRVRCDRIGGFSETNSLTIRSRGDARQ